MQVAVYFNFLIKIVAAHYAGRPGVCFSFSFIFEVFCLISCLKNFKISLPIISIFTLYLGIFGHIRYHCWNATGYLAVTDIACF